MSHPQGETFKAPLAPKTEPKPVPVPTTDDAGYKEPDWAALPSDVVYGFDTIKGGTPLEPVSLNRGKSSLTVGRLPACDIQLEHPSISRFHAILQFGEKEGSKGWHLFDLGSTHGTWLNKQQAPANKFLRLRVGHVIKFGWSTRFFILTGPSEDQEEESGKTVTQLIKERERLKALDEKEKEEDEKSSEEQEGKKVEEPQGIGWGMDKEMAYEETEEDGEGIDLESLATREEYYREDPVKALKHYFDRNGFEMNFEYVEEGKRGRREWHCRIELPVEGGATYSADISSTGSKKEAQFQCALEGCRILDSKGFLRGGDVKESQREKEREKLLENDFYESDEDIYLDRTGELERKRASRKRRLEGDAEGSRAKTYPELQAELDATNKEIAALEKRIRELAEVKPDPDAEVPTSTSQDLKIEKSKLRLELVQLKTAASKLDKLCRVAKPTPLPELKAGGKKPVWIGSMKGHRLRKVEEPVVVPVEEAAEVKEEFKEEVEEEEEETTPEAEKEQPEKAEKEQPNVAQQQPLKSILKMPKKPTDEEESKTSLEPVLKKPSEKPEPKKRKNIIKLPNYSDMSDPDFAVWMPPDNQTGDGKTSLNAKFGY